MWLVRGGRHRPVDGHISIPIGSGRLRGCIEACSRHRSRTGGWPVRRQARLQGLGRGLRVAGYRSELRGLRLARRRFSRRRSRRSWPPTWPRYRPSWRRPCTPSRSRQSSSWEGGSRCGCWWVKIRPECRSREDALFPVLARLLDVLADAGCVGEPGRRSPGAALPQGAWAVGIGQLHNPAFAGPTATGLIARPLAWH